MTGLETGLSFPIFNLNGETVAGFRAGPWRREDKSGPKIPEFTGDAVLEKEHLLYGLHLARAEASPREDSIIVGGLY